MRAAIEVAIVIGFIVAAEAYAVAMRNECLNKKCRQGAPHFVEHECRCVEHP